MTSTATKTHRQRVRLWEKQRGICWYCPAKMLLDAEQAHPQRCTADHRTPVQRGGPRGMANRVAACFQCNQAKGCLTEREFKTLGADRSRQINAVASGSGSIGGPIAFNRAIERLVAEAMATHHASRSAPPAASMEAGE